MNNASNEPSLAWKLRELKRQEDELRSELTAVETKLADLLVSEVHGSDIAREYSKATGRILTRITMDFSILRSLGGETESVLYNVSFDSLETS